MIKVAIVILSYNSAKDLLECLSSVSNLQTTNYELKTIVVDNNSQDNSVEVAKKFNYRTTKSYKL